MKAGGVPRLADEHLDVCRANCGASGKSARAQRGRSVKLRLNRGSQRRGVEDARGGLAHNLAGCLGVGGLHPTEPGLVGEHHQGADARGCAALRGPGLNVCAEVDSGAEHGLAVEQNARRIGAGDYRSGALGHQPGGLHLAEPLGGRAPPQLGRHPIGQVSVEGPPRRGREILVEPANPPEVGAGDLELADRCRALGQTEPLGQAPVGGHAERFAVLGPRHPAGDDELRWQQSAQPVGECLSGRDVGGARAVGRLLRALGRLRPLAAGREVNELVAGAVGQAAQDRDVVAAAVGQGDRQVRCARRRCERLASAGAWREAGGGGVGSAHGRPPRREACQFASA